MIEHDDEELPSPSLSPLSSCAGLHAFGTDFGLSTGMASNALSTRAIEDDEDESMHHRDLHTTSKSMTQQCPGHTMTSSMATTRGSQALLEAAMSSAICHPNIVQVSAATPSLQIGYP